MPRYRLTGVTAGSFGLQWQVTTSDTDIATALIDELEDRRLLWGRTQRENPDRCAASASYMRTLLATLIRTEGISRDLKGELKVMQGHFRAFMTALTTYGLDRHGQVDPVALERVLANLRTPVGEQIGLLAAQYDIEISAELAAIVPDRQGWFFEHF